MRNSQIKKEHRILLKINCTDELGNRIEIQSPVLLSIFQSEELMKAYKENPNRKYSVKEIYNMRNKTIPVKEATIRRALVDNKTYFETTKDIEIRGKKGNKTVMIVNFTTFKPIVKHIFKYIEEIWENEK